MSKPYVEMHNTNGSSNKSYEIWLVAEQAGYRVKARYGPIGRVSQTNVKTKTPVPLNEAMRIADELEAEKRKGGYRVVSRSANQTPNTQPTASAAAPEPAWEHPLMLLTEAEPAHIPLLIANDAYWMQEKHDGERRPVCRTSDHLIAANKSRNVTDLGDTLAEAFCRIPAEFIIDGEQIGNEYWAFDLLGLNGRDYSSEPFSSRYQALCELFKSVRPESGLRVSPVYRTSAEKQEALTRLERNGHEGAVFRASGGAYVNGRPLMGGVIMKHKFYKEASVVVLAKNDGKSSVWIGVLLPDGSTTPIGNVTIPPNAMIPPDGSVIEVRYLYAYRNGSLYQPTFKAIRTDVSVSECRIDQLRYKAEAA